MLKKLGGGENGRKGGAMQHKIIPDIVLEQKVCELPQGGTVYEAAKEMFEANVAAIVVTDKSGKLVGIVTERDLTRRVLAKGLDAKATAKENQRYLKEHTNYHSKSEIRRFVAMHFSQLEFLDLEIHRFTRLKMVYPIMAIIPGMKYVLGECHSRVMLIKK